MKKYAMIPINYKYEDDGIHIRRVLISYLFKTVRKGIATYHFTKFICPDYYFETEKATHKYKFENRYYKLVKVENSNVEFEYRFKNPCVFLKRRYHSVTGTEKSIEFKCSSRNIAIQKFKTRKELK